MSTVVSKSETATKKLASAIAGMLPQGGLVCLKGELGSGKTVFSKGFAASLGVKEKDIKSPTYTFVRQYELARGGRLYHFDFYRIESLDELMETDLREILAQKKSWILIEWPERVAGVLPRAHVEVTFEYVDAHTRRLKVTGAPAHLSPQ